LAIRGKRRRVRKDQKTQTRGGKGIKEKGEECRTIAQDERLKQKLVFTGRGGKKLRNVR